MKRFFFGLTAVLMLCFASACEEYECSDAQEDIDAATAAYTAAIDAGGDGAAECDALRAAMEKMITESACPQDAKDITQDLLNSLDCN